MYVIVKFASPEICYLYWGRDPSNGVELKDSAHETYTGRLVGLKAFYKDVKEAFQDCEVIKNLNPSGYYNVCPVLNQS